jgi:hypothetical protein
MMRLVLALACSVLPCTLIAQRSPSVGASAAIRREVLALEQRIGQANFDCDYRFFAEVEATEFIFTDPSGGVTTRAEDLAGEPGCRPRKGTYQLDEVRTTVLDSVVVFNALATTTVERSDSAPVVRRQRFTDVLVHRDGRWQLIAGHSSRVP